MEKVNCKYCNKLFSNKYSLNNHQKTAKFCLKLQYDDIEIINFQCNYCEKIFTSRQSLNIHLLNCKDKETSTLNSKLVQLEKQEKAYKEQLEKQEKAHKDQLEKQKIELKADFKEQLENQEKIYKDQIKDLINKLDKIANKAIDRPTTTINNKIELQTFLTQKEIDQKIASQFNDKYLWDGMKGVAQFVYDHIVKLEDGRMIYACFDTSRQIFKYKDEDGNEIKDPKAIRLKKMIKPGLLRQSQTLLDYFNDECDYIENRKNNGMDIDGKEYNIMKMLKEKAFEVGAEILSIEDTNKFSNELASLSCI